MALASQSQLPSVKLAPATGILSGLARSTIERLGHTFFGFSMIVASVGIGILPIFWAGSGPFAIRMVLAVGLLLGGLAMMRVGADRSVREIRFDALTTTLYVVRRKPKGQGRIMASHSYDDIGEVQITEVELSVLDLKGEVLVSVPLDGPQDRLDAVAQIRTHLPFLI